MKIENETEAGRKWALVDDEPMVLEILEAYIERMTDAEICRFRDPNAAYEAIRSDPDAYEMIVTDRNMPQMEGIGLLVLVREVAPHLRMVVVTGNCDRLEEEMATFDLPLQYVMKPFTTDQLQNAIATAPTISTSTDGDVEEADSDSPSTRSTRGLTVAPDTYSSFGLGSMASLGQFAG